MYLLSIDTSSNDLSLALMKDHVPIEHLSQTMQRGQGEALVPLIQALLDKAKIKPDQLGGVAVAVGPGSFTGVRIALSTARGIGLALNIPVYGVTNFEATAYGAQTPVTVVLDTKRGDYFIQQFDAQEHALKEPRVLSAEDLKKEMPFIAMGDGAEQLHTQIGCDYIKTDEPLALSIAHVALSRLDHPLPPEPLYLRDADVTV